MHCKNLEQPKKDLLILTFTLGMRAASHQEHLPHLVTRLEGTDNDDETLDDGFRARLQKYSMMGAAQLQ